MRRLFAAVVRERLASWTRRARERHSLLAFPLALLLQACGGDGGGGGPERPRVVNQITGTPGDDTLVATEDADGLDGAAGTDTVDYSASIAGVTLDLGAADADGYVTGGGGANNDLLQNIENIIGSSTADLLRGDAGPNRLEGRGGNDRLTGGGGRDRLEGGAGIDTAAYDDSATGVTLDLSRFGADGHVTASGGDAEGDVLKSIENLIGSEQDDSLKGDSADNTLFGGAGADRFFGSPGRDTFIGGAGNDTLDYTASDDGVTIAITADSMGVGGVALGDRVREIENLVGSDYADALSGDGEANTLLGGAGDDTLIGAAGADRLIGGGGLDTADYSASDTGVSVHLEPLDAAGYVTGANGHAEGDLLMEIENLIGSAHADRLAGDNGVNHLAGGDGDDTLFGSWSADTLDGGAGRDTVDHSGSGAGVTIRLSASDDYAIATGGTAAGDLIKQVENLIGSPFDDVLAGTDGSNEFVGGAGTDTLDYSAAAAAVRIDLAALDGDGYVTGEGAAAGDRLRGIENLIGSNHADSLTGDAGANVLVGGDGPDVLTGGGGVDTADYSASPQAVSVDLAAASASGGHAEGDMLSGIANLIGSPGDDVLRGDAADNVLMGGAGKDLFVLDPASLAGSDIILDFESGVDRLDIHDLDGDINAPGLQDFEFLGTAAFDAADASGQMRYERRGEDLLVQFSVDADSDAEYSVLLLDLADLAATSFVLTDPITEPTEPLVPGIDGDGDGIFVAGVEREMFTGSDTAEEGVDYRASPQAVLVNLSSRTGLGGYADGDRFRNIDNVSGSPHNDTLVGDDQANSLHGSSGDDFLDGVEGRDNLDGGGGDDTIIGGAGADIIDGGAQEDTLSYSPLSVPDGLEGQVSAAVHVAVSGPGLAGVTVDLSAVETDLYVLGTGRDAEGDRLKGIENLIGSEYDDLLQGDANANLLDGAVGWDTVSYSASDSAVTIDLFNDPDDDGYVTGIGGYAAGDRLKNVENLIGSGHDDSLQGDGNANLLDGGAGSDTVSYSQSDAGVIVALADDADGDGYVLGTGGHAAGDRLKNVENLLGSGHDDSFQGNGSANLLDGGAAGSDTVSYSQSDAAVTLNLATPGSDGYVTGTGGHADGDRLKNVDNLIGSGHDDSLQGDGNANLLDGGAGSDTVSYSQSDAGVIVALADDADGDGYVTGTGGHAEGDRLKNIQNLIGSEYNDSLQGDGSANLLDGGVGSDTVSYSQSDAAVTLNLATPGSDGYVTGTGGHAEGDRLKSIENLIGSEYDDSLQGDDNANLLDGGAGSDTVSYSQSDAAVTIDLFDDPDNDGYVTGTGGHAGEDSGGTDTRDRLKSIENLIGSGHNDSLQGDGSANLLVGGDGDDVLVGGEGDDVLSGGAGKDTLSGGEDNDTADYSNSASGVIIDLAQRDASGQVIGAGGDAEGELLKGIENLIGSDSGADSLVGDDDFNRLEGKGGADRLHGGDGEDELLGGEGNDSLFGDSGGDSLDGGEGSDTADYSSSSHAVTVYLDGTIGVGGDASGDSLKGIENLTGSRFDDLLSGSSDANILDGGAGVDTVNYGGSNVGVTVDLAAGRGMAGDAQGDTLRNIENLIGSTHGDWLQGDNRGNTLDGGIGSDTVDYSGSDAGVTVDLTALVGGYAIGFGGSANGDRLKGIENLMGSAHDDFLQAGALASVLDGGDGIDTVSYSSSDAGVTIDLLALDSSGYVTGSGGYGRVDRLKSIENLVGSDFNDRLQGDDGQNVFAGGAGSDTVDYSQSDASVTIDLFDDPDNDGYVTGTGGHAGEDSGGIDTRDRLKSIENLIGSGFDDRLTANAAPNTLDGGDGNDDEVSYASSAAGVTVSLANPGPDGYATGTGGHAEEDRLQNIENLVGSEHDDLLQGTDAANRLEGGEGSDTASYSLSDVGVTLDLFDDPDGDGYVTGVGGHAEGDRLKGIENLVGSGYDDVLRGDDGANVLNGGGGVDTVSYRHSDGGVTLNLFLLTDGQAQGIGGHAEGDRLQDVENLIGSEHADILGGSAGANDLEGGDGSDTVTYGLSVAGITIDLFHDPDGDGYVIGMGGHAEGDRLKGIENLIGSSLDDLLAGKADKNTLDGGAGSDTVSYLRSTASVTIDLSDPDGDGYVTGMGGHAEMDRLKDIENLIGSAHADLLQGDNGANVLDGGGELDTVSYSQSSTGVTIDLGVLDNDFVLVMMDGAENDRLRSIENLIGSGEDDNLQGDSGANVLSGGGGNDTLRGDGGDDTLIGGVGADVLDGEAGMDTANYEDSAGGVRINLANPGSDLYVTGTGSDAQDDRLKGIENLIGSGRADTLTGDAGDNSLHGGAGADTLVGGGGGDVLDGGGDVDAVDYGTSPEAVTISLLPGSTSTILQGKGGDAEEDQLENIENLLGSRFNDVMAGTSAVNILDGRAGLDSADYSGSTAVTIDLSADPDSSGYVTGTGGHAEGDRLKGIENLIGSDASSDNNDTLTGDGGANILRGGAGADMLDGDDGNDTLLSGTGADTLQGGRGEDSGDYSAGTAVTIDLSADPDSSGYVTGTGGHAEGDRLQGIENLIGSNASSDNDDTLIGDGNANVLAGLAGEDTLDGGGGQDTASYSASPSAVSLDLSATPDSSGYLMGTGGDAEGDHLKDIENLIGSEHADRLIGDAKVNRLAGGDGDDSLIGGAGADALDGGAGSDTADFSSSVLGVAVNLRDGIGRNGDAEGDMLSNVEHLIGSDGDDRLSGAIGGSSLQGKDGADRLTGLSASDTLDGGADSDTADYGDSPEGVSIDLSNLTSSGGVSYVLLDSAAGGHAAGDRLESIENLAGSDFADYLSGGAEDNILTGRGMGDTLVGKGGSDTADYGDSPAGVSIDLSLPLTNGYIVLSTDAGGDAAGDSLKEIENLFGSAGADVLRGDNQNNLLAGGAGRDNLEGLEGNDTLNGGAGRDILNGGGGQDAVDYGDSDSGVTIDLSGAIGRGVGGDAEGDKLASVEEVFGSNFDDLLQGSSSVDMLVGGAGDDTLKGGAGADTLVGGEGLDTADYSAADTTVTIDLGTSAGDDDRFTGVGGDAQDDVLQGIENLTGTSAADTLIGDVGGNTLDGGRGGDFLDGQEGNDKLFGGGEGDTLIGGDDSDTVDYSTVGAAVSINLDQGLQDGFIVLDAGAGGAAGDRLKEIENLIGTAMDDTLTGDGHDNTLIGGAGADRIDGGSNQPGGAGDTVSYAGSLLGVTLDLGQVTAQDFGDLGSDSYGDVLLRIENLIGSSKADKLTGNGEQNVLFGAGGDDTLVGGGGNDVLDGGTGVDLVDYSAVIGVAVTIDLGQAPQDHSADDDDTNDAFNGFIVLGAGAGFAAGNRLKGIENLIGTAMADSLIGDDVDNFLAGGEGDDFLSGAGGDDTLAGGPEGDDILSGGTGLDTADYGDVAAAVTISLDQLPQDNAGNPDPDDDTFNGFIVLDASAGGAAGDKLKSIENLAGSAGADTLTGDDGDNVLIGRGAGDKLDGGDHGVGGDTASYDESPSGVTLDLASGAEQSSSPVDSHAQGDVLLNIENLVGSAHADRLDGDENNNSLAGGSGDDSLMGAGGDDTLTGGAGADSIIGGEGLDAADYGMSDVGVTVDLSAVQTDGFVIGAGGHAEMDMLQGVEILLGSAHADRLTGDGNANILSGGLGSDTLDGGEGIDTADYSASDFAVSVDLAADFVIDEQLFGTGLGGTAEGDRLRNIENLLGSERDDILLGNQYDNSLIGGVGADILEGRGGRDTVDYSASNEAVTVDLGVSESGARTAGIGGHAAGDLLGSIEDLLGTNFSDLLFGNEQDNEFDGGEGVDSLFGEGADDTLIGGSGGDILEGGAGSDTASYRDSAVGVTLNLGQAEEDGYIVVASSGLVGDHAEGDRLQSIENLIGSGFSDILMGDGDANTLEGGDGADVLMGGGGLDTASYANSGVGVTVEIGVGIVNSSDNSGDHAQGDRLDSIENLIGSAYADSLIGNEGINFLDGGDGDDYLRGVRDASSSAGDTLVGGNGNDVLDYSEISTGVVVDLGQDPGDDGFILLDSGGAIGDRIKGIEHLVGTSLADQLTGDEGDNTLDGRQGGDDLDGRGGNDTLDYSLFESGVTIDLERDNDFVALEAAAGAAVGDRLKNIENLIGSGSESLQNGNFDDSLAGDFQANVLAGLRGNDSLQGGGGGDVLDGGTGTDFAVYDRSDSGVTLDLTATGAQGYSTGTGGHAEADWLKDVEHLVGSDHDDILVTGIGVNSLVGGAGNDTLAGGAGADTLVGGAHSASGGDTASYSASAVGVTVNLSQTPAADDYIVVASSGQSDDHAEGDRLKGIENLIGSAHVDKLTGGVGDSTLEGGDGSDTLSGGGGVNTASYNASVVAVTVDLSQAPAASGYIVVASSSQDGDHARGDQLKGIENLVGSGNDDVLIGDTGDNVLDGGAGRDSLVGGAGSDSLAGGADADTLDGAGDSDVAFYSASPEGVTLSLASGSGTGGHAEGDTLTGIEALIGSSQADLLIGSAATDTLHGSGGSDTLSGGAGGDTLHGGAGNDFASYSGSEAVTINLGQSRPLGQDYIVLPMDAGGDAAGDRLESIEHLIGSGNDDVLTGDAGDNILLGGAGADTLDGGSGGTDFLDGGVGVDVVDYGTATEGVTVFVRPVMEVLDEGSGENSGIITALAFSPGGGGQGRAIVAGADSTLRLWDTENAEQLVLIQQNSTAASLAFGMDGKHVIAGNQDGSIGYWRLFAGDSLDPEDSEPVLLRTMQAHIGGVSAVALSPDLDVTKAQVVSGGDDGIVRLWDLASGEQVRSFEGHEGKVNAVAFHRYDTNDNRILSGGSDRLLRLWDAATGVLIRTFAAHQAEIRSLVFSPDGDYVLSAGDDRDIHLWDTNSGVLIRTFVGHESGIRDLAFSSDGRYIASGGQDGKARLWDAQTGIELRLFEDQADTVFSLAFDPVTHSLLIGGSEGNSSSLALWQFGAIGSDILEGIEILRGSAHADTLLGSAAGDTLVGRAGADRLEGLGGADTLNGGPGEDILDGGSDFDTADYSDSDAAVIVDLASTDPQSGGHAEGDILRDIEHLLGSSHADTLRGDDVENFLLGGEDSDVLEGREGPDTLEGGAGSDSASYSGSNLGVTVNLGLAVRTSGSDAGYILLPVGAAGDAVGDRLKDIENLIGSRFADRLQGDDGSNRLDGGGGDDTLEGGLGRDFLDGGGDVDVVLYIGSANGVTVDLSQTAAASGDDEGYIVLPDATDSDAANDRLKNIENLVGSDFADVLTGSADSNSLRGVAGADTLEGGGSADILEGGEGIDTASYAGSALGVTVDLGQQAETSGVDAGYIVLPEEAGGDAVGDRLKTLENLLGSSHEDVLTGDSANNLLSGGPGKDFLDGAGGTDTASYAGSTDGVTIDLGQPAATTGDDDGYVVLPAEAGGDAANDRLKRIENLAGSAQADNLIGNNANNVLAGGPGGDFLDGAEGTDTASYADSAGGVTVDLSQPAATGGDDDGYILLSAMAGFDAVGDRLKEIENLLGSVHADVLTGDQGENTLTGALGADTLAGGQDADVLDGGEGLDVASYAGSEGGVSVNLGQMAEASGYILLAAEAGFDAAGDRLKDIENLVGSTHADSLVGDDGDNILSGGEGADVLQGGGGADTLQGGAELDTAAYNLSADAVTIDLGQLTNGRVELSSDAGGDAANDRLESIENLVGTVHDDVLAGDAGSNVLEGGAGADDLDGAGGADTVSYAGSAGGVTVDLGAVVDSAGADRGYVLLLSEAGFDAVGDRLKDIERLLGSEHADLLTGDGSNNMLFGADGTDTLQGGGGADTLDGGAGSNTASYAGSVFGVTVDLGQAPVNGYVELSPEAGGDAAGDRLNNIQHLIGSEDSDMLQGDDSSNTINGGKGADFLDGAGGADTISYALSSGGVTVDLGQQAAAGGFAGYILLPDTAGGDAANDRLKGFENVQGSVHEDFLKGDAGVNVLLGDALADTLEGGGGADRLDGGEGADTASYIGALDAVTVSLDPDADTASADGDYILLSMDAGFDAMGDRLRSIENLIGSQNVDMLMGDTGDNTLQGGRSPDFLNGGTGSDTASYSESAVGVTVDLSMPVETLDDINKGYIRLSAGIRGDARGDRLKSIENLIGSDHDDTLTGDAGDNVLFGGSGNDTINGGKGSDTINGGTGSDILDGGEGVDTVSYSTFDTRIRVAMQNQLGIGFSGRDTLLNIENVVGTAYNDFLTGDEVSNLLNGAGGDDVLNGAQGIDTLLGGDGADVLQGFSEPDFLDGGAGIDIATYHRSEEGVTVNLGQEVEASGFNRGYILLSADAGGQAASDRLKNIENIQGSNHVDVLTGDAGDNLLIGLAGVDSLNGGEGADTLEGGSGADILDGGIGQDAASYAGSRAGVSLDLGQEVERAGATAGYILLSTNAGGDAVGDRLKSIENLIGSPHTDVLIGDIRDNVLEGGHNTDAEYLDGSAGSDTASYASSNQGVTVDLSTAVETSGADDGYIRLSDDAGGHAAGDRLKSMENLLGSGHNDVLTGDTGGNRLSGGAGADVLEGGGGGDLLDGGADLDVASYAGSDEGVTVNLRQSTETSLDDDGYLLLPADAGGHAAEDRLKNIENLVGSVHADSLTGDSGDNVLEGGSNTEGSAVVAEYLDGGPGSDTASYASSDQSVTVDLSTAVETSGADDGYIRLSDDAGGHAAGDRLRSIENLLGSDQADTLTGTARGGNTLSGGGGNDTLQGGGGADVLDGGAGSNTASYAASIAGVTIDLGQEVDAQRYILLSVGAGGHAAGDRIRSIENLIGSEHADVLAGTENTNSLSGGDGDDTLQGGAGPDWLDGGDGADTAEYADSGAGITVDLSQAVVTTPGENLGYILLSNGAGGTAADDRLKGIENLVGSNLADKLTGSDSDNTLHGGNGRDTLSGGRGNDTINGGLGLDVLVGGMGIDTLSYDGLPEGVAVTINTTYSLGVIGAEVEDTSEFENLIGTAYDDSLRGDSNDNALYGGAGDDTLSGGQAGMDTLEGGAGNDTLGGSSARDILHGGAGLDTVLYTGGVGVTVDLTDRDSVTGYVMGSGGDAEGDLLKDIEGVTGTVGADMLTGNDDNNILRGMDGLDSLSGGGGADTLEGGEGTFDVLDGGGGIDTLSYESGTASVTLNLGQAVYIDSSGILVGFIRPDGGGDSNGDFVKNFENLIGSLAVDTLMGDSGDNVIEGGPGGDRLDGKGGENTASYALSAAGVHVDLNLPAETSGDDAGYIRLPAEAGGDAANDRLRNFKNLAGSDHSDTLIGDLDDNSLSGGLGADVLIGRSGSDVLDGNSGLDTASYASSSGAVTIDLGLAADGSGYIQLSAEAGGDAANDRLRDIENLVGSASPDRLTGDAGDNTLEGGEEGDYLHGGLGSDTASYVRSGAGVTVDLSEEARVTGADAGYIRLAGDAGGDAANDRLKYIENLAGSEHSDNLTGDDRNNVLRGFDMADSLQGAAGFDTLYGGSAGDFLDGGENADVLYGEAGADTLAGGAGADTLYGGTGNDLYAYGDTLQSGVTSSTWDLIKDFESGDSIDLRLLLSETRFDFIGTSTFDEAANQVRYQATTVDGVDSTSVEIKVGSIGVGPDMIILLEGTFVLTASDFML